MKIQKLFTLLFIICALIASQLSFCMELTTKKLKPAHTISIDKNFIVHNIAFDKNETIANLLLSKNNQQYLRTYNLSTKTILADQPIDEEKKLTLFAPAEHLSKNIEPYAVHRANNTTTIWENATKKPLYTLSPCAPILCAHLNNSKTQLITASNDGNNNIVNIWRLKKTINFICGQDNVSVEDTNENRNILSHTTIGNMLADLSSDDLNGEIPLQGINNRKEFDNFFDLVKLVCENNLDNIEVELEKLIEGIKLGLNKLDINQLCSFIIQCNYYNISSQKINLTNLVCQIIADKYNPKTNRALIRQLPPDLQTIIAQERIKDCINHIDSNQKPLFSVQMPHVNLPIAINWNDKTIAIATGNSIKIWDLSNQQIKYNLVGHTGEISSIAISPDGNYLATGSYDHMAKVWDLNTGQIKYTLVGHTSGIHSITFSHNNKCLATGSYDSYAKVWDMHKGECLHTLKGHSSTVRSVTFSPDSNYLAAESWDKIIKIWDLNAEQAKYILVGHTGYINSITFSPKDNYLATGSNDRTIIIWDLNTGHIKYTLAGYIGHGISIAISPDGKYLAAASIDGTVMTWDLATGHIKHNLVGHTKFTNLITISLDGNSLATVSEDKTTKIWNLNTGQVKRTLAGHINRISSVSFSPDGKNLITWSNNDSAKVWDIDDAPKQTFLNKLTIEQADFLAEKIYPVIKQNLIFKIIENSEEHKIWMTFLPAAQQYLKNYIQIAPYQ